MESLGICINPCLDAARLHLRPKRLYSTQVIQTKALHTEIVLRLYYWASPERLAG